MIFGGSPIASVPLDATNATYVTPTNVFNNSLSFSSITGFILTIQIDYAPSLILSDTTGFVLSTQASLFSTLVFLDTTSFAAFGSEIEYPSISLGATTGFTPDARFSVLSSIILPSTTSFIATLNETYYGTLTLGTTTGIIYVSQANEVALVSFNTSTSSTQFTIVAFDVPLEALSATTGDTYALHVAFNPTISYDTLTWSSQFAVIAEVVPTEVFSAKTGDLKIANNVISVINTLAGTTGYQGTLGLSTSNTITLNSTTSYQLSTVAQFSSNVILPATTGFSNVSFVDNGTAILLSGHTGFIPSIVGIFSQTLTFVNTTGFLESTTLRALQSLTLHGTIGFTPLSGLRSSTTLTLSGTTSFITQPNFTYDVSFVMALKHKTSVQGMTISQPTVTFNPTLLFLDTTSFKLFAGVQIQPLGVLAATTGLSPSPQVNFFVSTDIASLASFVEFSSTGSVIRDVLMFYTATTGFNAAYAGLINLYVSFNGVTGYDGSTPLVNYVVSSEFDVTTNYLSYYQYIPSGGGTPATPWFFRNIISGQREWPG